MSTAAGSSSSTGAGAGCRGGGQLRSDARAARGVRRAARSGRPTAILVLLMLEGGNDGLNTVVPTGESRYYQLRPGTSRSPPPRPCRSAPAWACTRRSPKIKALYDQGDGRGRPGRRLPEPGPQPLHVDGHLDERLGRREPARWADRLDRPLSRRPPQRGVRDPLRRGHRQLRAAAHGRVGGAGRPVCPRTSAARSASTVVTPNDVRMFDAVAAFGGRPDPARAVGRPHRRRPSTTRSTCRSRSNPRTRGRSRTATSAASSCSRPASSTPTSGSGCSARRPRRLRHALGPGRRSRADLDRARRRDRRVLRRPSPPPCATACTIMTFSEFGRRPEDNDTSRHRPRHRGTAVPRRRPGEGRDLRRAAVARRASTATAT